MRILAIKWRRLGDTVLWTAALEALRQLHPEAEIDLALPAEYLPLFAEDRRFAARFPLARPWRRRWESVAEWRRRRYDLVLAFHASHRTLSLAVASGARLRLVHHHRRRPRNFLSQRRIVALGEPMAAVQRDLNVVRTLGWDGVAPAPRLFAPVTSVAAAAERLRAAFGDDRRPLVVIGPTASRPAKQWPLERYAALAARLAPSSRVAVVFDGALAGADDPRLVALARAARLLPTPTLPELLGVLSHAACYVGSDSGVKHVAAALGRPTVTLFGPESVGEWHPYARDTHRVVRRAVGCRRHDADRPDFAWCGEAVCPLASHACLLPIDVDDVAPEVMTLVTTLLSGSTNEVG